MNITAILIAAAVIAVAGIIVGIGLGLFGEKFKVEVDENLETKVEGLYALGDGSGVTHSLSQASASGVHVARILTEKYNGKEAK